MVRVSLYYNTRFSTRGGGGGGCIDGVQGLPVAFHRGSFAQIIRSRTAARGHYTPKRRCRSFFLSFCSSFPPFLLSVARFLPSAAVARPTTTRVRSSPPRHVYTPASSVSFRTPRRATGAPRFFPVRRRNYRRYFSVCMYTSST